MPKHLSITHNAENRPIRWTQGNKVITMDFDRMGRRTFYKEMEGNRQITHTVFLYDGYLCIQQLFSNSPWNVYKEFIWDPTEPLATRPLCFRQYGQRSAFLLHDGNKNVTDVVTVGPFNEPVAHYDYAPFGAVTVTGARALANPFRFSSEFHDDTLALVYYNYRHYNPKDGRWQGRDPMEEEEGVNLFAFNYNNPSMYDRLGLSGSSWVLVSQEPTRKLEYKCTSLEGCTPESLASIVGLRPQEFKEWVSDVKEGTSDPNRFCEAKVPNTVLKFWAGDLGWFGRGYTAWRSPTSSLSVDYFVEDVMADEETSEEFLYDTTMRALAKQKELIGTLFMGHGDSEGWLYNGKKRKMATQITGLPYKLKFAEIRACYSNKNKLKDGVLNYTGYDGMLLPMPFCNGGGVDW